MRANFRNGRRLAGKEIEDLFMQQSVALGQSVARIMTGLSRCIRRERPGRGGERQSKRPRSTWPAVRAA